MLTYLLNVRAHSRSWGIEGKWTKLGRLRCTCLLGFFLKQIPEWLQARGVLAFAFGFKDAAIVSEPEGQALVSVEVVRLGLIHSFTGARGWPGSFVLVLD